MNQSQNDVAIDAQSTQDPLANVQMFQCGPFMIWGFVYDGLMAVLEPPGSSQSQKTATINVVMNDLGHEFYFTSSSNTKSLSLIQNGVQGILLLRSFDTVNNTVEAVWTEVPVTSDPTTNPPQWFLGTIALNDPPATVVSL